MTQLVTVIDPYGAEYIVSVNDLDGPRIQLPLYTKHGGRMCDYHERMNWSGQGLPTTIHRENISIVKGPYP